MEHRNIYADIVASLPAPTSLYPRLKAADRERWKDYTTAYAVVRGMAENNSGGLTIPLFECLMSGYSAALYLAEANKTFADIAVTLGKAIDRSSIISDHAASLREAALNARSRGHSGNVR